MTDYKEEQRNEIEALESIYPSEFSILEEEPCYSFSIQVKTDDFQEDSEEGAMCYLTFTYVPTYPDDVPVIEVNMYENLDDSDAEQLQADLAQLASENLGMVMVFTLVSAAQDWLAKHVEDMKRKEEEDRERKIREAEEAERKRFEGTRVTVESFISWKAAFDAEMLALKKQQMMKEEASGPKKLTGRELFEKDTSLIQSDMKFLQDGEEEVKVDESLFEELDDLQIDDELAEESSGDEMIK